MKSSQLKSQLSDIIARKSATFYELQSNRDNPQVKEIMSRIDAEITAFRSILDALNDNPVLLNCY